MLVWTLLFGIDVAQAAPPLALNQHEESVRERLLNTFDAHSPRDWRIPDWSTNMAFGRGLPNVPLNTKMV